jgi:hypothetical protein
MRIADLWSFHELCLAPDNELNRKYVDNLAGMSGEEVPTSEHGFNEASIP